MKESPESGTQEDEYLSDSSTNSTEGRAAGNHVFMAASSRTGSRKEKSLGVLNRQFIALYFKSAENIMSLEQAAKALSAAEDSVSSTHYVAFLCVWG